MSWTPSRRHRGADAVLLRARLGNQTNVLLEDAKIDMGRGTIYAQAHPDMGGGSTCLPTDLPAPDAGGPRQLYLKPGSSNVTTPLCSSGHGVYAYRPRQVACVAFCPRHSGWYERHRIHLVVYRDWAFRPPLGCQKTASRTLQYQCKEGIVCELLYVTWHATHRTTPA